MAKQETNEEKIPTAGDYPGMVWVKITKKEGWENKEAKKHYPKDFIVSVMGYKAEKLIKDGIGVQVPLRPSKQTVKAVNL